jgi:putative FmdB family regulatory protein
MPLFEYLCENCGKTSEILIRGSEVAECAHCGGARLIKLLSAHSAISGISKSNLPGQGDTGCCGSSPGEAPGCAGPGSCCGKGPGGHF